MVRRRVLSLRLKAQYIWYFGGGIIGLLILFSVLYISGVNAFICIGIILIAGTALTIKIYALSNTYGEHGMMKKLARRSVPKVIKSKSREVFGKHSPKGIDYG